MMKTTLIREKLCYVLIMFNYSIRNYVLIKNNEIVLLMLTELRFKFLIAIYALDIMN